MSYADHIDFGGTEYHSKYAGDAFQPFEHRRKPGLLVTSLMAAMVLSVASGAIVINRLNSLPTVNPDDAVGPITEYTGLQWQENAARKSGVIRERLAVLTPPVYSHQPLFSVSRVQPAERVDAEITGAEAQELTAHLEAYPSADAMDNAQTAEVAEAVAADVAAAEAMAQADTQSVPEPRYILEEEIAPPEQIVPDDSEATGLDSEDNAVIM
jgi:hypothetical protein